MASGTTPPLPGSMTVPVWYGWEAILGLLVLAAVAAVVFFLVSAAGKAASQREEWREMLAARSSGPQDADPEAGA
jgi:hypothetical protein